MKLSVRMFYAGFSMDGSFLIETSVVTDIELGRTRSASKYLPSYLLYLCTNCITNFTTKVRQKVKVEFKLGQNCCQGEKLLFIGREKIKSRTSPDESNFTVQKLNTLQRL